MTLLHVFRERLRATSTGVLVEARRRTLLGDLGDAPRTADAQNTLLTLLDEALDERGVTRLAGLSRQQDP